MYKICNIDLDKRAEIANRIDEYCQEIVARLDPQAIILFGSFASGDINEGSDIDILVISQFEQNFLDRIKLLLDLNSFGLPVEPLGYTAEEFNQMRDRGNPFIEEVIATGKLKYGSLP